MENITLGQIAVAAAFLAGLIASLSVLVGKLRKWITKVLEEQLEAIKAENQALALKIDKVDQNSTKNFLVARIGEIEAGREVDEVTRQRIWEQYQHYIETGGNSYIKRRVEQLKGEGRL